MTLLLAAVAIVPAVILLWVFAWLMAKGNIDLVNVLDAKRVRNPRLVARWLSALLFVLGLVLGALGIGGGMRASGNQELGSNIFDAAMLSIWAILAAILVVVVIARIRYLPKQQYKQPRP